LYRAASATTTSAGRVAKRSRSAVRLITNCWVRSEAVLISSGTANAVTAESEKSSSTNSSRCRIYSPSR
jgi:hypothetical protein